MSEEVRSRIAAIASNRESGASEILERVNVLLLDVLRDQGSVADVGRALIAAQPSMAPVWNAVRTALAAREDPDVFDRYVRQVALAPRVLNRELISLFEPTSAGRSVHVVTLSYSRTVLQALQHLADSRPLRVSCAEGRPALEGRRLATHLAKGGIPVTCYTDAALAHALTGADAVVVGADAVTPEWFLNKSGTRMLAAAALLSGVPLYVLASRDKFVSAAVGARLRIREGAPDEVWPAAPDDITVQNPYFERTPLEHVAAVVTDMGVLGAGVVPQACPDTDDELLLALL